MNEEEKEAIEFLKHSLYEYEEIDTSVLEYIDKNHKIIYKLILKQQKEIEKYRKLRADIIKVNKKIYDVDIIEDMCEQLANSISKDKIKEKIEEITSYAYTSAAERDCQDYAIQVLKELLGE